jgi:lipoate-protein ligase A
MDALEIAIRPPVEKLERHGVASVRQRVVNIAEIVAQLAYDAQNVEIHPALKSVEALEKYIVEYFTEGEIHLSVEDVEHIEKMAQPYIVKI